MTSELLIVVGVLSILWLIALALSRRSGFAGVVSSLFALGLAAFCGFGFLASFEYSPAVSWPWQIAYGIIGLGSFLTALLGLKAAWSRNKRIQE